MRPLLEVVTLKLLLLNLMEPWLTYPGGLFFAISHGIRGSMDLCNLFVFIFDLVFVSVRRKSELGSRGGFAQIIGIPCNFLAPTKTHSWIIASFIIQL